MARFLIEPKIKDDLIAGTEGNSNLAYVGKIAEIGNANRKFWFGGSKEFVGLILGQRGSGKSHTLGTIAESFATKGNQTSVSKHETRRGMLLLDPMGNFWTMAYAASKDGGKKAREQFAQLAGWDCAPEDVNVDVWVPAGHKRDTDPDHIREFRVKVSDLGEADIADLIGVNLIRDPQGAALSEAYHAVVEDGWDDGTRIQRPKPDFSFQDLVNYLDHISNNNGDHQRSTLNALKRSLNSLIRQAVFTGIGTPLTDLVVPDRLGILMLPHRIGEDLRLVITRLLIRRILMEREEAAQIRQRLDVEVMDEATQTNLEEKLQNMIPRSILAIDEAQELLGDEGGEARQALEAFCLLGRNYGLSLLLATQRPTTSAISAKVRSRADIYIIHRLLTQDDINIVKQNLLAVYPEDISLSGRTLDFTSLLRNGKGSGCCLSFISKRWRPAV